MDRRWRHDLNDGDDGVLGCKNEDTTINLEAEGSIPRVDADVWASFI